MSKGIMSILVISSCLNVSVWICAHALLYEVVDSKFQVPSSTTGRQADRQARGE
jgi:hypothetical protein